MSTTNQYFKVGCMYYNNAPCAVGRLASKDQVCLEPGEHFLLLWYEWDYSVDAQEFFIITKSGELGWLQTVFWESLIQQRSVINGKQRTRKT